MLEIRPVHGIGDVLPGTDLAETIAAAAPWLRDGDILVVTSKIVSKAEGRLVAVPPADGPARELARQDVIAAETARTVAVRGPTRIVATHHGFIMAAAGVDASNVDASQLVLLPKDPDGSARALRAAIAARVGVQVGVVISDTMGRPWRNGLTDVALGAAGVTPLRDHRGETDPYGNQLQLTQPALVDELAGAADLVKGKTQGVPVAVVRGLSSVVTVDDGPGVVTTLVRDAASDMFSLGTAEARAAGLRAAATLSDQHAALRDSAGDTTAAVDRALATVAGAVAPSTTLHLHRGSPVTVRGAADPEDPQALVRLGADLHRLQAALAAEDLGSRVRFEAAGVVILEIRP